METLITNGVKVSVETSYHPHYSVPVEHKIFFAYKISIQNLNDFNIQLLSRYWLIEDSDGMKREVKGEGVVGEQPILAPGQTHSYTSGCPLRTGIGKMSGHFIMENKTNGSRFEAEVPLFKMYAPFIFN